MALSVSNGSLIQGIIPLLLTELLCLGGILAATEQRCKRNLAQGRSVSIILTLPEMYW